MSRPPMDEDAFFDEPTQQSAGPPTLQSEPAAPSPAPELPRASIPSTDPRPTRPTVLSPTMSPHPLARTLDVSPPEPAAVTEAKRPRTLSLRVAALALFAALLAGTAIGFAAHGWMAAPVGSSTPR